MQFFTNENPFLQKLVLVLSVTGSAVWDSGYEGKSSALLVIYNTEFEIKQNARIFQLVFFKLDKTVKKGYEGIFHKEGI